MSDSMKRVGAWTAGLLLLLAVSVLAIRDTYVHVRPMQVAVVDPVFGEPYARGPRSAFVKLPFFDRMMLVNPLREHIAKGALTGELADGSACAVEFRIVFRVAEPMRYFLARRADGLALSETPEKALSEALRQGMARITPAEASAGAVERLVYAFQKQRFDKPMADGVAIRRLRTNMVGCSDAVSYVDAVRNRP